MNKEYHRKYHANRSPEKKQRKQELQRLRIQANILLLRQYKAEKGCKDCGESDPIVLDFDHIDREGKKFQISNHARFGWSMEKLMEEIAKCEVVCANCHRRRTAKQLNWHQ